jgi:hypothetical protein
MQGSAQGGRLARANGHRFETSAIAVRAVLEKGAGWGGASRFVVDMVNSGPNEGQLRARFTRHAPLAARTFVFSFDKRASK